jgi:hypothetical protein
MYILLHLPSFGMIIGTLIEEEPSGTDSKCAVSSST